MCTSGTCPMTRAGAGTPRGGPSTVHGVLYQTLVAFGGLAGAVDLRPGSGADDAWTIVIEPDAGGDLQTVSANERKVVQVKARTTGSPWSLREVVEKVLPDLYGAMGEPPAGSFVFLTDGRIAWNSVYQFFRSLRSRDPVQPAVHADRFLKFNRRDRAYWQQGEYSELALFEHIVDALSQHDRARARGDLRLRVWHLLRGFEIATHPSLEGLLAASEREVLDRMSPGHGDAKAVLAAMLVDIQKMATKGNVHINRSDFLARHGLSEHHALSDWSQHVRAGAAIIERSLERQGLALDSDVRPGLARRIAEHWLSKGGQILLTGESGFGKTWLTWAMARELTRRGFLVLAVEARGSADLDLQRAAQSLWHDILGRAASVALLGTREWLRRLGPDISGRPIFLIIDGIQSIEEARDLVSEDWTRMGMNLLVTGSAEVMRATLVASAGSIHHEDVGSFDDEELAAFLERAVGPRWVKIPRDVRDVLRRPLSARIYRDLLAGAAATSPWLPRLEYELHERLWERMAEGVHAGFPMDRVYLARAAVRLLIDDAPYPWSEEQFCSTGQEEGALTRLTRSGWIRRGDSGYEVSHDRLLNWAAADGLIRDVTNGVRTVDDATAAVLQLLRPDHRHHVRLGYTLWDAIWMSSSPVRPKVALATSLLKCAEGQGRDVESVYGEVARLGHRIAPALWGRLDGATADDDWISSHVATTLGRIGGSHVKAEAVRRLGSGDSRGKLIAARVLTDAPTEDAIDLLWALHKDVTADPESFGFDREHRHRAYSLTFEALATSARRSPEWLVKAIEHEPAGRSLDDLSWLLIRAPSLESIWPRVSPLLFEKSTTASHRVLALLVAALRDSRYADLVTEWSTEPDDDAHSIGYIVRALAALNPDKALEVLEHIPDRDLYMWRSWYFDRIALSHRDQLMGLLERRTRAELFAGAAIQGHETFTSPSVFDTLLDGTVPAMVQHRVGGASSEELPFPYILLSTIGNAAQPGHLDRLRARRGTPLEAEWAAWVRRMGPPSHNSHAVVHDALEVLAAIGGPALTPEINAWLRHENWLCRFEATKLAVRRPDQETLSLLRVAARSRRGDQQSTAEAGYAAAALAECEDWEPALSYIVELGLDALTVVARGPAAVPLDDSVVAGALAAIVEGTHVEGGVMAIAFARRADHVPVIIQVLEGVDPSSRIARACALALIELKDQSPASVPALAALLAAGTNADRAVAALAINGSSAARSVLYHHVQNHYKLGLVLHLLDSADQVQRPTLLALLGDRLRGGGGHVEFQDTVIAVAASTSLQAAATVLLDQSALRRLREYVHSGDRERFVELRVAAIRVLSWVNPSEGIEAAVEGLVHEGEEAERYPSLVVELAREKALGVLCAHVQVERRSAVLWSVGRALGAFDVAEVQPEIQRMLHAGDPHTRIAACRVAERLAPTKWIEEALLQAATTDLHVDVGDAALRALATHRNAAAVMDLVGRVENEVKDVAFRWTLLDGILRIADPGDADGPLPDWFNRLSRCLSPAMWRHAMKSREARVKDVVAKARRDIIG